MVTSTAPVADETPLLRNRNFNLLWFGEGVSVLGNTTTLVLLPLLAVLAFDAGAFQMGLLTAAGWLPWLVIGLPAGAWVDRLAPRSVMVVADLVAAATLLSVPVAWWAGVLTMPQLLAVALLNGACTVFFRTAYVGLVRQVAPAHQQESAFSRLFGTESAMQVAGPGIGGAMAQLMSAAGGLLLDVVSFLVSAVCLVRLRLPATARDTGEEDSESLGARIAAGIRYLARDRILRFFTVLGSISNFGLTGYGALLVVFMVRELGLGAGGVGVVMALGSVGGLLGALVATRVSARLGSARALIALQLLAGPPALLIPLATPGAGVAAMILGVLLVGLGVVAGNVIRNAWRNRYVPVTMVARQVTTTAVINYGSMPVAAVAAGALGEAIGLRGAIAAMAGVHALACLGIWFSPIRGLRDMPVRPTAETAARPGGVTAAL